MSELEEYEKANEKASQFLEGARMPLYSWDLFSNYFVDLKSSLEDDSKLREIASENHWNNQWDFLKELTNQKTIVVTDSQLNIVFASQNIIDMTGYSSEEILGKNPKMFQGEETSLEELQKIRTALNMQKPFEKTLVNYKKNGEKYLCHIKGFPVFNSKKELVNFVAFEKAA